MDEPNAFALPGGHIYVSRGLLVVANSEAELANVLGHEIGHVAARHAARQDAHVKTLGLASLLSDLMSGGEAESSDANEPLSGNFVRALRAQPGARGRSHRPRAGDRRRRRPLRPRPLPRRRSTSSRGSSRASRRRRPTSRRTRPRSERMIEAAARAQEHEWRSERAPLREWAPGRPVAATRAEFLAHLDGLTVGRPGLAKASSTSERFLHPDLGFSLQFPSGWQRART